MDVVAHRGGPSSANGHDQVDGVLQQVAQRGAHAVDVARLGMLHDAQGNEVAEIEVARRCTRGRSNLCAAGRADLVALVLRFLARGHDQSDLRFEVFDLRLGLGEDIAPICVANL
jgi:hypothetical protein